MYQTKFDDAGTSNLLLTSVAHERFSLNKLTELCTQKQIASHGKLLVSFTKNVWSST